MNSKDKSVSENNLDGWDDEDINFDKDETVVPKKIEKDDDSEEEDINIEESDDNEDSNIEESEDEDSNESEETVLPKKVETKEEEDDSNIEESEDEDNNSEESEDDGNEDSNSEDEDSEETVLPKKVETKKDDDNDEYFFDDDLWEFEDDIHNDDDEYEIDNDLLFFDDKDIKKELGNLLIANYRSSSLSAKFYSQKLDNFFEILRKKYTSLYTIPFEQDTFCPNVKILIKIMKNVFNGAGDREKLTHLFDTKNVQEIDLDMFLSKWTKQSINDETISPISTELTRCKKMFVNDTDVIYYWTNDANILEDMRLVSSMDCVEPIGIIFTNVNVSTNPYEVYTVIDATEQFLTKNCIVLFSPNSTFEKQLEKAIPSPDAYLLNSKIKFNTVSALLNHFPSFNRIPKLFQTIKRNIETNSKIFKKTFKQKKTKKLVKKNKQTPNFLKYKSYPFNNTFIDDDFGRFHHLLQRNDKGNVELLIDMEKYVKGLKTKDIVKPQTFPKGPPHSDDDKLIKITRNGFIFPSMLDALNDHKYIHSDDVAYVCMPDNVILPLKKHMLQNKLIWVIDQNTNSQCHKFHLKTQDIKKYPQFKDLLCQAVPGNLTKDSCVAADLNKQKDNLIAIEGRGAKNNAFISLIKQNIEKEIGSMHLINVWNYEKNTHHINTYLEESREDLGDVEYVSDPSVMNTVLEEDDDNDVSNDLFLKRIDDPSATKLGKNIARIVQSLCVEIPNSQLLQLENFINLQFNDTELGTRQLVELKPMLVKIKTLAQEKNMTAAQIDKSIKDAKSALDAKYKAYKSKFNDISIFITISFLIIYIQTKLPKVLINPSALPAKDEANILGYPLSGEKAGIIPYFASIIMYYMKQNLQVFTLTDKYDHQQIQDKIIEHIDLLLKKGVNYKDQLKIAATRILEAKNEEQFRIKKNIAKFGVWDMFRPPINFDENKDITNEAAIFVKNIQLYANKQDVFLFRSDKTKYRINSCCRVPILESGKCLSDFYQSKQISDILTNLVKQDNASLLQRPCTFNFKRTRQSKSTTDYEISHKVMNYKTDTFVLIRNIFKEGNLHFNNPHNLELSFENKDIKKDSRDLFNTNDPNISLLNRDAGAFSKLLQEMGNDLLKSIEQPAHIESFKSFLDIAVNIDMNKLRGHVYVNHTTFIQSYIAFFSKIQNDYVFTHKEAQLKKMNILTSSLNEHILSSKEISLLKEMKDSREEISEYLESALPYLSTLHEYLLNIDPYKCIILNIYSLFKAFTDMLEQFSKNLNNKLVEILIWMVNDYITRYNLAFSNNDFVREEYEKQREMKKQDTLKKTKNVGDETLGIYRELKKRNMLFDLSLLNDNLEANVDIQIEGEGEGEGETGEIERGDGVIRENNEAFDMDGNDMPGEGEGNND